MKRNLIRYVFVGLLCGVSSSIFAQNVGINSTATSPSVNAILDLNSGNSNNLGLLVPNVTLGASLATFNPPMANAVTAADNGMLVYNSVSTNWPIGYYLWNGSAWVSVAYNTQFVWDITGNSGTSPSTANIGSTINNDFVGTTDANDLVIASNDRERLRIASSGNVGLQTKTPASTLDDSGSFSNNTIKIAPAAASVTALGSGTSVIIATPPAIGATYTLTLPSATASNRRVYTILYYGSGAGTIAVTSPVAGSLIENGAVTASVSVTQGSVTIQSDGTNWDVINVTSTTSYGTFVGMKYLTATTPATAFDAGTTSILVKVIGGGGAGGGGSTTGLCVAFTDVSGAGGGAGGYVEGFVVGLSGSSTYAVSIGAGGAGNSNCSGSGGNGGQTVLTITNPGVSFTGNGGHGAANTVGSLLNVYAGGGVGGTATSTAAAGTFLTIPGATGASSIISVGGSNHLNASGFGAGTTFGAGGCSIAGRQVDQAGVSASAASYGAGGGGACIAQETGTVLGGSGAKGVVIIYEYQ